MGISAFTSLCPERPPGLTDTELVIRSMKNPPRRAMSKGAARAYNPHDLTKSLEIPLDVRYQEMDHYKDHGGTNSKDGHFARLIATNRRLQGLKELAPDATHDPDEVMKGELEPEKKPEQISIQGRVNWQRNFDREVKGLFQDFQLTDVPTCRLNHLERMGTWFTTHGAKQARKVKAGPSYLTADRALPVPPGSTKDLPSSTNNTTLILREEFMLPRKPSPSPRARAWR